MKQFALLLFCLFTYVNSYSQWWIPDEQFGDEQYWETDAVNYQDYPYTTFKRNVGYTIPEKIQNIRYLINEDHYKRPRGEFYLLYKSLWEYATNQRP